MSDWRSKPRNGKAQFMKHLDFIQSKLRAGETQNAIRTWLVDREGFEMSASQFSRHLNAFRLANDQSKTCPAQAQADVTLLTTSGNESRPNFEAPIKAPLTKADFRQIRKDVDNMDLDALVSGKGVVYHEQ